MSGKNKQNERQLNGTEEKYKLILDNANDLITIISENLEHEYINEKAYFNLLGYKKEDIIGKTPLTPLHPDDLKKAAKSLRDGFKSGEGRNEMRVRHKDGHFIWLEHKGKTFIDVDGKKKAIIISRDITERKKAEQKIKESEEKYRLISENANDLISIFNENLQFEYINKKSFLNILGYNYDELIGKKGIEFVHLEDRDKILKTFIESNKQIEGSIEARVKHKFGHYITTETNGKTFIDKDGKQKFLVISRDITNRKREEETIIAENKKLQELSKIKSELIMRASHEFKTPLSSVYAASQILLNNFKNQIGEKALGFLEMIYRGSQKLKQLIENLLDISRFESGNLNLNLQVENLVEIIIECCTDLEYWANKRNIKINHELPKEIFLSIDRIRMEQVVINILSNAIKYTPPKGNIYININGNNQWIDLSIRDTGIGLTKKEKEILFQKFGKIQRVSEDLDVEVEGSGLGLFISKEIVELHHGKILVESKGRGKGSTFILRLPKSI